MALHLENEVLIFVISQVNSSLVKWNNSMPEHLLEFLYLQEVILNLPEMILIILFSVPSDQTDNNINLFLNKSVWLQTILISYNYNWSRRLDLQL